MPYDDAYFTSVVAIWSFSVNIIGRFCSCLFAKLAILSTSLLAVAQHVSNTRFRRLWFNSKIIYVNLGVFLRVFRKE